MGNKVGKGRGKFQIKFTMKYGKKLPAVRQVELAVLKEKARKYDLIERDGSN
jgi:hypothetical protein